MYPERDLIEKLRRQFAATEAIAGIGDDTAVLDSMPGFSTLFCSDLLVENTHFRRDTHPPHSIGYKAIAINVSDVGAMGGDPVCSVLSMVVSPDTPASWIDAFLAGIAAACSKFSVELVGGDTASGERMVIDVAMLGRVERGHAVRRSGAQPGDGIFVTGSLGASARGLELLAEGVVDHPAVNRHLYPEPRHTIGQTLRDRATAMIDISDGFSTDLYHILESSQVSARIDSHLIPRAGEATLELALNGGEDYELIVTGRDLPGQVDNVPLTRVGEVVESGGEAEARLDTNTGSQILRPAGWQHFDRSG